MNSYRRRMMLAGYAEDNLCLYGKSIQNIAPSPDAPVDILSMENPYIKVVKRNILKYPYYQTTKTMYGITYTDNGDGSITINGTATAFTIFEITQQSKLDCSYLFADGEMYTLSKTTGTPVTFVLCTREISTGTVKYYYGGDTFKVNKSLYKYEWIRLQLNSGAVAENVTVYPMISKGMKDLEFRPYTEEIISIDGYTLKGVGEYRDRIYTKDGKVWYEQRAGVFNTDENTVLYSNGITNYGLQVYTQYNLVEDTFAAQGVIQQQADKDPGLCTHFVYSYKAYAKGITDCAIFTGTRIWILTDNFATQTQANQWIKENKVTFVYPLTKFIVTEITGTLAEKILAIDKTDNISILSSNGVSGTVEVTE